MEGKPSAPHLFVTWMPRLFIALRPPEPVRDVLVDTMEALDNARWQDDEQLHLTLRFVGEVDNRQGDDLAAALACIAWRPFAVHLSGTGHFARKGQPIALHARAVASPELLGLRTSIERACIGAGLPPETRAFVPHVTIARLNRSAARVGEWLARHGTLRASWTAEAFSLFESHLSHTGAAYEEVVRYEASRDTLRGE